MSMWYTGAFGEDPRRPTEFIWHVPEYDENGNLVSGDPNYYLNDPPPIGHSGRQGSGIGLNTSIKGGLDEPGPAVLNPADVRFDAPGHWGPDLAGELHGFNTPEGDRSGYPAPSSEQLAKDTYFTLGPNRDFQWPGGNGKAGAEAHHNDVAKRGFVLENSGTEEEPVPSYRHIDTGARIEPSGDEDEPWQLITRRGEPEKFFSTHSAAEAHQDNINSLRAQERSRIIQQELSRSAPGDSMYSRSRPRSSPRSRGARGSRPTNVPDAMRHAVGTASYVDGRHEDLSNSRWDLRNEGTTFGGHPMSMPASSTGMLNNYVSEQYQNDLANNKIQHVIYHHQTPLAWLRVDPDENASGGTRHTWVIPDERYSNTSSRRQSAIRSAIRSTNHGDAIEEPYDPARGIPNEHLGSSHPEAQYGYLARSYNARDLVNRLAEQGFTRPDYNSRQAAFFMRPTTTETEEHYPGMSYGWTSTRHHGVYLRPTKTSSGGAAWVVGEHEGGTNKIQGSKRFASLDDALHHADRMHEWIRSGQQGPSPSESPSDNGLAAFQRDIRRNRNTGTLPRNPAPLLEGQEELPLRMSSVMDWSDFLRG